MSRCIDTPLMTPGRLHYGCDSICAKMEGNETTLGGVKNFIHFWGWIFLIASARAPFCRCSVGRNESCTSENNVDRGL